MTSPAKKGPLDGPVVHVMHQTNDMSGLVVRYGRHMHRATWSATRATLIDDGPIGPWAP